MGRNFETGLGRLIKLRWPGGTPTEKGDRDPVSPETPKHPQAFRLLL